MDITFTLQSVTDGSFLTGRAANTTVYISKDGGSYAATTNAAAEVGRGLYKVTLTSAESEFSTLYYQPVCTGAQTNTYAIDAPVTMPTVPTAQDNASAVWGAQTKVVTIDSTQAATLATAAALTTVGNNVSAVKAKTDNLPASPAAVGSEMALTSAAITAVQNGLSTFNASTDTVTLNATEDGTLTAIKTKVDTLSNTDLTGIATATDISNAQSAIITRGNEAWTTATGFTVPGDLLGLATTEGLVYNLNLLTQHGNTYWVTASGFATPSDIPTSDITAIKTKVDSLHNTDLSGVATALSVEKIHAGLFNWSLDEDVINAKNTSGTVIVSSTITRDSSGNITAMEEGND